MIRVIIESGLLYTLTAIIMLATSVAKTNADYIPGDVVSVHDKVVSMFPLTSVARQIACSDDGHCIQPHHNTL